MRVFALPSALRSNATIWFALIFVEGFASLGIEIIALRRLVPQVGSSITVTAPTIALFLLALAAGYWSGGRIAQGFAQRVLRNFLLAGLIAGIGLSGAFVQWLFDAIGDLQLAYLLFMAAVVCPPAWLLAQTVPLLTNVLPQQRVGAASGVALTASTAGSVLGAAVLALVVMQRLGVSAAVLLCAGSLAVGVGLAARGLQQLRLGGTAALVLLVVVVANVLPRSSTVETAYADYRTVQRGDLSVADGRPGASRTLMINNQLASRLIDGQNDDQPPKRAAYIERLQRVLLGELHLRDKQLLVLGAGGFTLSIGDETNHYTYVDVDPAIRQIAERDFLGGAIRGDFIAQDARSFVRSTERRFDAVVVDVYSSHAALPSHLVTLEFWRSVARPLAEGGVVLANLILDSRLQTAFARNLLATIERALGRCTVQVLDRSRPISNVLVVCAPGRDVAQPVRIYTDDLNRVELDRGILGY